VHLFYLVGFQNRLLVVIRWSVSFATRGRGARLIGTPDTDDTAGRSEGSPDGSLDGSREADHHQVA
jgi:NADH dehydrogenase